MRITRLNCPFEVKSIDENGVFTGYASVFGNIDAWDDVVMPGAFTDSLARRKPAMLWQHDTGQPIGVWRSMNEDGKGLLGVGELLIEGVPRAREAYALLKAEALNGLSIGYVPVDYGFTKRDGKEVRELKVIDLWEVSLVTFPANDAARVTGVKGIGDLETVRDVEEYLRDAGLTRSEAKGLISQVKTVSLREADTAALIAQAQDLIIKIKGA